MKRYIVKNRKSGDIVAVGNAMDCMKKLKFSSISSFRSMVTHCKTGVNQKYVVHVDKDTKEDSR